MNPRAVRPARMIARVVVGGVFAYAGALKLRDPQALADSVHSFAVLPNVWINPVALGLPVLEVATGVLLVTGLKRRACAGLAAALSIVFAAALAQALIRGIAVDCGCFGAGAPSVTKTLWALARDLGLAGLAVFAGFGINAESRRGIYGRSE